MLDSVLYFIRFGFFFLLYLVFIPAKLMGRSLRGEAAGENALKSLIVSYVTIISCVYLLGLAHIYNTATLAGALLVAALAYLKLVRRVSYREQAHRMLHWLSLVLSGRYKLSVLIRRSGRLNGWGTALRNRDWMHRPGALAANLVVLASLGTLIWNKWPLVFDNYAYLTSDMYVHHDWINFMELGDIFHDGVYPFGMHNMLSAFHKLTGLHLNVVFRYWGAVNCLLLAVMLYFFARRVFRSRWAAALAMVIYCVTDFTGYNYGYRAIYTLPQELGMIFLFPCVYFLGKFLRDKRREDGLYFAFASSLTLSMHFYTVIMAVFLCCCCCAAFARMVVRPETIKRLASCIGLIALLSILPLLLGLASGKYWQGSMNWALSVITASESQEEETPAEETTPAEEAPPSSLQRAAEAIALQVRDMNSLWGYAFWAVLAAFGIYLAVLASRKRSLAWEDRMCAGIWLFLLVLAVLYGSGALGLPQLMQPRRVSMFIGYAAPLLLAWPVEWFLLALPGRVAALGGAVGFIVPAALCLFAFYTGTTPVQTYFYLEHSLAARTCVNVEREFPEGTWTIVSPVEELSLLRGGGYHYELWEFISNMERFQEDMYLEIPTRYVFFILEKEPLSYNEVRADNLEYRLQPLDLSDAETIVSSEMLGLRKNDLTGYYSDLENRRILEAKLARWLEEYGRLFPSQMEVYLEDDECVVYKFEQDLFMPNNFAVDYGCNAVSDAEYYERLRTQMLERGEDVSEVDGILAELRESPETRSLAEGEAG